MHGLGRAAGCGIPLTLAGRTWLMLPVTLGVTGTIENHMLAVRGTPEEALVDRLGDRVNSALGLALLKAARDDLRRDKSLRVVEVDDMAAFMDTDQGFAIVAWLCLVDPGGRPAFRTLEQARQAVRKASPEELREFRRRRDIASGTDAFAAADWPAAGGGVHSRWIAWRKLARDLAEGMQPVGALRGMTHYELRILSAERDELGGIKSVPVMDGAGARRGRRHEKGLPTRRPAAAPQKQPVGEPAAATPHPIRDRLLKQGKFKLRGQE